MNRRFWRTTIISWALLAFLVGLVLARLGIDLPAKGLALIFCIWLVVIARRKTLGLLGLVMIGLTLGLLRGQVVMQNLQPVNKLYGQKVVMRVTVATDGVYGSHSQLSFDASKVNILEPISYKVMGVVKVSGFGENMVHRGDVVLVSGKLRKIPGSSLGAISFAKIKLQTKSHSWLETVRLRFLAGMQSALPEPMASFGTGLLVGLRSTIPKNTTNQLSAVGLSHVVAVSGYNLTIIVSVAISLMRGKSKYQTTLLAVAMIFLFLLLTGISASIVRAAIVSLLSIWAWYYGRRFRPLVLVLLAAALTAGWNPAYIWGDSGWYLSFAAFFGVMVLAPLLLARLGHLANNSVGLLLTETVCAQIMTAPIIMTLFHEFSLVAVLANLLVVPLVPLAMLLSLVAGLGGMLVPALVGWFAWPAKIVLTFMLDVVGVFARVPHSLITVSLPLSALVLFYLVVAASLVVLARQTHRSRGTITDKKDLFNRGLW